MGCIENLSKCKAICCKTFFIVVDNMTEDLARYFRLHGLEVIDKTIRFEIPCKMLDRRTLRCMIQKDKPKICAEYPKADQPVAECCVYYKKKT